MPPTILRTTPNAPAPDSATRGRPLGAACVIVGRAVDIPRALEHPMLASAATIGAIEVGEEEGGESAAGADIDDLIRQLRAASIFVAGPLGERTMRIVTDIALLNGCRIVAVMPSEVLRGHNPVVVWEGDRPLVQLLNSRRSAFHRLVKRSIDVCGAVVGILLAAPFALPIAVAVRWDSRGPVFFRHRRVGRGGVEFPVLKFRTMVADAEAWLGRDPDLARLYRENDFRLPDEIDPRLTRVGRFLRRTSLDELPQFWNVLIGEMSLVGPRPIEAAELEHYAGSERLLLSVRPGITGLWAVTGRHGLFHPKRAEIELHYVRSWSLAGDLRILLRTIGAVASYDARPRR